MNIHQDASIILLIFSLNLHQLSSLCVLDFYSIYYKITCFTSYKNSFNEKKRDIQSFKLMVFERLTTSIKNGTRIYIIGHDVLHLIL